MILETNVFQNLKLGFYHGKSLYGTSQWRSAVGSFNPFPFRVVPFIPQIFWSYLLLDLGVREKVAEKVTRNWRAPLWSIKDIEVMLALQSSQRKERKMAFVPLRAFSTRCLNWNSKCNWSYIKLVFIKENNNHKKEQFEMCQLSKWWSWLYICLSWR